MEEAYPPGTWAECLDATINLLLAGTVVVMDIPLSVNTSGSPLYQILSDNGTTASIPLAETSSLIPPPPIFDDSPTSQSLGPSLLPPFLAVGSQITYKHEGIYHTGYLTKTTAGTYHFNFKMHVKKKSKSTFQTYHLPGSTYALRASYYQDILHTHLFNHHCRLLPPQHMIPLPIWLAQ
jgi:hypothetical protein